MVNVPKVNWAQRANVIYLEVNIPNAKGVEVTIKNDSVSVNGTDGDGTSYAVTLPLFKDVDPEVSKIVQLFYSE